MRYIIDSIKKEQTYQHTGIMVLVKAATDLYGIDTKVIVANSLNQGFFVYMTNKDGGTFDFDVNKIRHRMQDIVNKDIPIVEKWMPCREAVEIWKEEGLYEKARLFEAGDPEQMVVVYDLDGYRDYFYSDMLPSTGYLEVFELRKYQHGMLLRHPCMLHPNDVQPYRDDNTLYNAFAESKKMRKHFKLDYLADLNDKTDDEVRQIIKESELFQESEIHDIAKKAVSEDRRLVLIAGPSSSGKTTFAKKLCSQIKAISGVAPIYLGTDDYFKEREETPLGPDGEPDFEGLGALDLELFRTQMADLLAGKEVDIPEFEFVHGHKEFGKRKTVAALDQTIVIEGIHSLNDELTRGIPSEEKFKIYISPLTRISIDSHNRLSTTDARLFRRMVRDNNFRGRPASQTLHDWPKVRSGENTNVFPSSPLADVVFNSSLVYETALLKHFAKPLLEEITPDQPEYEEARRLIDFTNCFRELDLEDAVPENSILREFIGSSIK